jgi:glutathione S-transferase
VRLFVSQLDFAPFYKFLMTPDAAAHGELRAACEAALAKMEARFGAASAVGPYFLGEALSAADIAVLPFLQRFAAGLDYYRAWALEEELGTLAPRLAAALKAARTRPAWQATTMAPGFYVAAYSGYAAGKQTVLRAMPRSMLLTVK